MNGAESLVRTLVAEDVTICFTNPGTSEMHFVAALDRVPGMRCILGLFEGVVTGAADGYYRVAGKPAATLLHLGPGLGNGLANLHNAKKARSGIVNIVGEHATYHIAHDAPLTSDIVGVARPMSDWVKVSASSKTLASDAAAAISVARETPGKIATLIVPADNAWGPAESVGKAPPTAAPAKPRAEAVKAAAQALSEGQRSMLLLGGAAVRGRALELAGRIAAKTGCQLCAEFNNSRQERGAGRVNVQRMPYPVDLGLKVLSPMRHLVLAGSKAPVAFFAYPDKPSVLTAEGCRVTPLAAVEDDLEAALEALAAELGALNVPPAHIANAARPAVPSNGPLTPEGVAAILGAQLPENAIVVDESITAGRGLAPSTAGAPPHDWLGIMGGSIGFGLPNAVGAAVAAPDRKVICLEGDGSGMYTVQALWTMARAGLDVTVLVFANRSYQILRGELAGVGGGEPGRNATDMLTIDRPTLDWVSLAKAQGVEAGRATNIEELNREFARGLASSGPYLIEVVL